MYEEKVDQTIPADGILGETKTIRGMLGAARAMLRDIIGSEKCDEALKESGGELPTMGVLRDELVTIRWQAQLIIDQVERIRKEF